MQLFLHSARVEFSFLGNWVNTFVLAHLRNFQEGLNESLLGVHGQIGEFFMSTQDRGYAVSILSRLLHSLRSDPSQCRKYYQGSAPNTDQEAAP